MSYPRNRIVKVHERMLPEEALDANAHNVDVLLRTRMRELQEFAFGGIGGPQPVVYQAYMTKVARTLVGSIVSIHQINRALGRRSGPRTPPTL